MFHSFQAIYQSCQSSVLHCLLEMGMGHAARYVGVPMQVPDARDRGDMGNGEDGAWGSSVTSVRDLKTPLFYIEPIHESPHIRVATRFEFH